jgi:hypothetical protein
MLKSIGTAASSVVIVLLIVSIGAFSLVKIEGQPIWQIVRNVMLAALGEETQGIDIQGEASGQRLNCDYKTGVCRWER